MRSVNTFKRNALALGVGSALALSSMAAVAAPGDKFQVDINGQDMGQAVRMLAKDAGVQIIMPSQLGGSVQAPALQGEYTLVEALNSLVSGTNLKYEFLSDDSVAISEEAASAEGGDEEPDEEVVITGTRLKGVSNAGAQVIKLDRDDFEKRGFTSMQDVLRSLPQNNGNGLASFLEAGGGGPLSTNPTQSRSGFVLGGDFANLRGLGTGRTLVLINGRRTAASQSLNDTSVDLSSIPFNSIERIDIMLDGGSAVYGSDAQGGVINIITRKDYSGLEVGGRYQDESTGGGEKRLQFTFGHNWDGGSVLLGATSEEVDPIIAAETLYGGVQDLRPFGGPDNRSPLFNRMPRISNAGFFVAPLGEAIDTPIQEEDFLPGGRLERTGFFAGEANRFDNGFRFLSSQTETTSAFVTIQQDIGERVRAQLDVRYNETDRVQERGIPSLSLTVPASNAFNGTDEEYSVTYNFVSEVERGLINRPLSESTTEDLAFDLSTEWDITDNWLLRAGATYSENEFQNVERALSVGVFDENFNFNRFIAPGFEELLADSNPETAFNPFGDGSTNTMDLRSLALGPGRGFAPTTGENKSFDISIQNTSLFDLPGGSVSGLVGLEQRTQTRGDIITPVFDPDTFAFEPGSVDFVNEGGERDVFAYFFEFNVPIIGENNALPGIQELTLSIQGRVDDYEYDPGSSRFTDLDVLVREVFDANNSDPSRPVDPEIANDITTQAFDFDSGLVPRIGVNWQVTDDFRVRMSYSESFRAPELGTIDAAPTSIFREADGNLRFVDPLNPDADPRPFVEISEANFALQPETGETRAIGFDWSPSSLEGFQLSMTLNDVRTEGVFAAANQFLFSDREELLEFYAGATDFFESFLVRDPADNSVIGVSTLTTNFGNLRNRALDFNTSYAFDNDSGSFVVGLNGVYTGRNTQVFPGGEGRPIIGNSLPDRDGTEVGPDTWAGNVYVNYSRDQLDLNLFVNYSSSYINSLSNAFRDDGVDLVRVEGYWTIDVTGGYNFEEHGIQLNAGIRNLTDNDAPLYNFTTGFFGGSGQNLIDPARVDLRGRMAYLEVTKSFEF